MSVGNIEAIKDWLQTNYSLSYKQKALETYFTKYYITFSGVPYETVTATNGSLLLDPVSITLDEDGLATTEAYFLPGDTVTFVGSHVSYAKEYTFGIDTNVFIRIMPDGALFWYNNQCVDVTGGWELKGLANANPTGVVDNKMFYTNVASQPATSGGQYTNTNIYKTKNKINISNYNKISIHGIRTACTYKNDYHWVTRIDLLVDDYITIVDQNAKSSFSILPDQKQNAQYEYRNFNKGGNLTQPTLDMGTVDVMIYLYGMANNTGSARVDLDFDTIVLSYEQEGSV